MRSVFCFLLATKPTLIWLRVCLLGPFMRIVTDWGFLHFSTKVNLFSPRMCSNTVPATPRQLSSRKNDLKIITKPKLIKKNFAKKIFEEHTVVIDLNIFLIPYFQKAINEVYRILNLRDQYNNKLCLLFLLLLLFPLSVGDNGAISFSP